MVSLKSLRGLWVELIEKSVKVKYLSDYKFSQVHLEIFFSAIRSHGGVNNNPTQKKTLFNATYKRLLIITVQRSMQANCIEQLPTIILVGSTSKKTTIYCR